MFEKALELKEEVFGEKVGYLDPKEVSPIMSTWSLSFFLVIGGAFFLDLWGALIVGVVWLLLNYSFFNAKVKL